MDLNNILIEAQENPDDLDSKKEHVLKSSA